MRMPSNFRPGTKAQQMNLGVGTFVGVTEEDRLLRTHEAAEFLAVAVDTLKRWRRRLHRSGPPFIRVGGRVRYSLWDLRRYLKNRTVVPGEENRRAR
jgi:hypothetical protein